MSVMDFMRGKPRHAAGKGATVFPMRDDETTIVDDLRALKAAETAAVRATGAGTGTPLAAPTVMRTVDSDPHTEPFRPPWAAGRTRARPYAPQPEPVPEPAPAPLPPVAPVRTAPMGIFAAVAAEHKLPSPLWCASCGTDFVSETAGDWDRMLYVQHQQAATAGWGRDRNGAVCCPACLPPQNPPVLAGGVAAEVTLAERLAADREHTEGRERFSLAERIARFDRAEAHRRAAAETRRFTTTHRAVA